MSSPKNQRPGVKYGSAKMVRYNLPAIRIVWIDSLSKYFHYFLSSNFPNSFPFFFVISSYGIPVFPVSAQFASIRLFCQFLLLCRCSPTFEHVCIPSLLPPHASFLLILPKQQEACQRLLFFHVSAIVLQFCRNWRLAGIRLSWQQESTYL